MISTFTVSALGFNNHFIHAQIFGFRITTTVTKATILLVNKKD